MHKVQTQHASKTKILDAAVQMIRAKGYSAMTIDDVCLAAGLTKGSFFHHFKSKEALALAAAGHFAAMADRLFAQAPYRALHDPLERLLGYVDFRIAILQGRLPEFTCLLGTMVQETFESHPAIRKACDTYISAHAAEVAKDIAEAKSRHAPDAAWSAEGLGLYTQAVIQGAFILAKAKGGPEVATECLGHLRRYLKLLFLTAKPIVSLGKTNGVKMMRFMIIVKATKDSEAGVMPSAQLLADMGKFNQELMDAGVFVAADGLQASSKGARVTFSGKDRTMTMGPFSNIRDLVAGYWIWKVNSLAEAIEWVKRCPNPMLETSDIEIRQLFEMEDFAYLKEERP